MSIGLRPGDRIAPTAEPPSIGARSQIHRKPPTIPKKNTFVVVDQAKDQHLQPGPTASPTRTVGVITARSVNLGDLLNRRLAKPRHI
jgi:hypothetical protein